MKGAGMAAEHILDRHSTAAIPPEWIGAKQTLILGQAFGLADRILARNRLQRRRIPAP
jgi:hypothetical protein